MDLDDFEEEDLEDIPATPPDDGANPNWLMPYGEARHDAHPTASLAKLFNSQIHAELPWLQLWPVVVRGAHGAPKGAKGNPDGAGTFTQNHH